MENFKVCAQHGSAGLSALFPDFKGVIKVDPSVSAFLQLNETSTYEVKSDFYVNFEVFPKGGKFFELLAPWPTLPRREKFLAMLTYLGTPEGFKALSLQEEQDEANVLLGYFKSGAEDIVFHVEHEHEAGKGPEIHLHGSKANREEDSIVTVFHIN
jgi:hypothetical protein